MQGLLNSIWQSIKQFFSQLFGSSKSSKSGLYKNDVAAANRPLSDTDYEFLFSQLLDGVAHGWHEGRILKYFEDLGERGKSRLWLAWLERFEQKVLASAAPNLQLAARMMRLGELAQSFPATEPIGLASYEIGRQLYTKEAGGTVWEYEGPDTDVAITEIVTPGNRKSTPPPDPKIVLNPGNQVPAEGTETLTLEELMARLGQDSQLAEQLAAQLGIQSTNPQEIVDTLIAQFQVDQNQLENQALPTTVEGWFNLGIQQANLGDLEAAIASWDRALEINPSLSQAWHNRGSALGNLGRLEEAIASFERAIALNTNDFQSWNAQGNAFSTLERWEEAITCWDHCLELELTYYQAYYNRGTALENLDRIEEAIASYRQALEIKPGFELAIARLDQLL
ncbi:tetratricopeptide repeat protein [Aphanothece sacrum]|uniref:Uncharacterized protein n=1 Tax=Aphanothece sacrum FPU1 TaxID=1920663 RepID=A0A401IIZ7_APHSA|nr:tetratricopeptide repeat protein [Aphanothece sacrum]GBF81285.1 hypothetical protein AsFPU1_2697 [Aphanothece sacrum FPU1]GBF83365.1 hypothetical protein AsFPU3_0407 [Aphanothece sacrum FPU3]